MKHPVLITGTTSGLGLCLSDKFEKEGHRVFRHKGRAHHDLSSLPEIKDLAKDAREFGVKILINNAAITCPSITLEDYNIDLIEQMVNVNLMAPILLSYLLIEDLVDVININSMVGLEIKKPRTLYSATKWGLRGFSESFKAENSSINMLDVYPTNIKTRPDRENAMDIDMVVNKIYQSFVNKDKKLILDGRKK